MLLYESGLTQKLASSVSVLCISLLSYVRGLA